MGTHHNNPTLYCIPAVQHFDALFELMIHNERPGVQTAPADGCLQTSACTRFRAFRTRRRGSRSEAQASGFSRDRGIGLGVRGAVPVASLLTPGSEDHQRYSTEPAT